MSYIINNVAINANNNLQQIKIGLNTAFLYDGVTQTVPLLGDTQDLSTDSFLYDINSANAALGSSTGSFSPTEYTYTDSEGEEVTLTFYLRDFISRGIWFNNGEITQIIEPPETAELGGESAIHGR